MWPFHKKPAKKTRGVIYTSFEFVSFDNSSYTIIRCKQPRADEIQKILEDNKYRGTLSFPLTSGTVTIKMRDIKRTVIQKHVVTEIINEPS